MVVVGIGVVFNVDINGLNIGLKKEKKMKEISKMLQAAKKRKPDAYKIIGAVSGLGEKRIKEIAGGSKPSVIELSILNALS